MNLVIDDTYIDSIKQYIAGQCESLDNIISRYIKTMETVIETGIMEGKTADALKEFLNQVKSVDDKNSIALDFLGREMERVCTHFIEKINEADKELY